ncbi:nucleoside triphosphate pyrophosphohydrolase family protein [archaeon]|nr:nucleoside triphosphate pyrophosphohydrolase family protein [archaeon]MBL7057059.1 nucleoside triphosphate pyrophosphohydrolase family protein [Candidatus Woesearchaeota archaeon]
MELKEYQELCKTTSKTYDDPNMEIMNWGLGVAGEAGDLVGCIKKTVAHKNDQVSGIKENIGDTMWYLAMICNFYGWDFSEVLDENIDKLQKRYPKGFSHKDAGRNGTRVDWNEK